MKSGVLDNTVPSLIWNGLNILDTPLLEYSHTNYLLIIAVEINGGLQIVEADLCASSGCLTEVGIGPSHNFRVDIRYDKPRDEHPCTDQQ